MSTRTYELTVPVRKGERGMGIVVNPENCVIELAADGPAMADGRLHVGDVVVAVDGVALGGRRVRDVMPTLAKKPAHDFRVRRAQTETREMLKNVRERELDAATYRSFAARGEPIIVSELGADGGGLAWAASRAWRDGQIVRALCGGVNVTVKARCDERAAAAAPPLDGGVDARGERVSCDAQKQSQ